MTDPSTLCVGATGHTHSVVLTAGLLEQTALLMAEEPTDGPMGVAFVLALRTVLSWGHLPDGAVMIGHRCSWLKPVLPGQSSITHLSIVSLGKQSRRYREVTLGYQTETAGEIVIEQEQRVLWPNGR